MGNDFRDLGKDIGSAVRDAITSGDFSDLNGRIANTVTDAISDLEERLRGKTAASDRKDSSRTQPQKKNDAEMAALRSRFTLSPKGRYSGFFMQFFGVLAGGAFGLAAVVTFVGAVIAGKLSALPTLLTVLCTIAGCCCALVYHNGKKRVQRVERFRKYVSLIGQKTYISIEELAAKSRKTEDYVVKDLEAMLELDMFPHGHLDDEKKTLLLTEAMFDEYRRLKKERILAPVEMKKPVEKSDSDLLFRETEEKGEYYLRAIRKANDAIPGEAVSQKLDRLENIVRRIFEQVKAQPSQIGELRRFLEYYMPTTLKLVETYEELDRQEFEGANIKKSKEEIEKTLDTINSAFEKLFDSLFENTSIDISSDISVLKSLLNQEGLTEKDFT